MVTSSTPEQSDLTVIQALLLPRRCVTPPLVHADSDLLVMLSVLRELFTQPCSSMNPPRARKEKKKKNLRDSHEEGWTERNLINVPSVK